MPDEVTSPHEFTWIRIDWITQRLRCVRCRVSIEVRTDHVEGVVAAGEAFVRIHAFCELPDPCPGCKQIYTCDPDCENPLGREQVTAEQLQLPTTKG